MMFHFDFRRAGFLSVLFFILLSLDYARAGSATWTPASQRQLERLLIGLELPTHRRYATLLTPVPP